MLTPAEVGHESNRELDRCGTVSSTGQEFLRLRLPFLGGRCSDQFLIESPIVGARPTLHFSECAVL